MLPFVSALTAIAVLIGPAAPAPPTGDQLAALAQPAARTSLSSQRIYFVMTDRFANGDTSNDRGGASGSRGVTGYDPADIGWFHGGDFEGMTERLQWIEDLGFTAVWVTPPVGQKAVQGDSAAYHGYWGTDFTSVDPHLGTNAEFAAFVDRAHALGLKVFMDVVVNHTADVVIPGGGSSYSDLPYRDCRGRVFRPAQYVTKTFPCLRASDFPRPPVLFDGDETAKSPAWLNDVTNYHNRGDVDFGSCSEQCLEQGDFFGLDDLFTEQPDVMNGLVEIYADWIRRYKLDGFRLDTARHVNAAFFRLWVPKILAAAQEAGVPDFQIFGEVFDANALNLVPFVKDRGLPNVLDFPFQDAATSFAAGDSSARGVATRLHDDDYFRRPDGVAPTPPTFLGNHDMGRVGTLIRAKSGAAGESLLKRVLLAHDLMYLLRGAPVVYYGDEVGMTGTGGDKAARQDMFPTQVREWQTEQRVGSGPVGTASSFEQAAHPIAERLRVLARLRDEHPALATGPTVVRSATATVLVVSRFDTATRTEYVAVVNAGTTAATVPSRPGREPTTWTTLFGAPQPTSVSPTLTVPALSSVLLSADTPIAAGAAAKPTLKVAGDDLSDTWRATATVPGGPVSVTFALLRKGKAWQRLATDDSPPYRAFVDPRRFRRNEPVHLVAVARSLSGEVSVSKVVALVVKRR